MHCDFPQGTPVLAPKSGTVKNVYSNTQGGNQLIIDHTQGFRTGYAHLSKSVVSIGQKIRKGQVIAYSGNTGHSTGPHLHLTLRKNGELVNPEDYFRFRAFRTAFLSPHHFTSCIRQIFFRFL
ncbi:MAG: M23 family metallopeptidase [Crocinitomicaceae bacterium]|nr:M23 family metallopeptidase [Crocinitomicaceae bacterium]